MKTRICLVGATGRMGKVFVERVLHHAAGGEPIEVVFGLVEDGNAAIGTTLPGIALPIAAELSTPVSQNATQNIEQCNVIVDFSNPEGTHKALAIATEHKLPILVCTSGLGAEIEASIEQAKSETLVIRASNTSVGVNVMLQLVRDAALALGEDFDIEISEIHHNTKRDAPSGTALALAQEVTKSRTSISLEDNLISGRFGMSGSRGHNELGVFSMRGGDVAGEHTVYFFGSGERLEITHRSTTPRIFADGAIRAARWLVEAKAANRPNGQYTMSDVLGLNRDS